jgi:citrate lyase subunit beta/citryl-CoA lyase
MRSMLFVPADSEKKMAKALGVGADALILDLEDAVSAANKAAARPMAAAFVVEARAKPDCPRLYVRLNAFDTPYWQEDLAGVIGSRPDGLILPKCRTGADVDRLAKLLDIAELDHGLPLASTAIIALATELPGALLAMPTFIDVSSRMTGLTWGAEDLSALVGSAATREADGRWTSPYQLARDLTLFAAVAGGRQPIDTVYVDFRDAAGLDAEARRAARDGFTGKMAIHPDQVAIINAAFTPSEGEVAWAREIVALFAANPGAGALSLRGQMIDKPHAVRAERILARARLAGRT